MARDSRMANRADSRAAGMVTSLSTRVSERWLATSPRAIGVAPGTEDTATEATVRIRNMYDDSVNEVRPVSSFRKRTTQGALATKVTRARQDNRGRYEDLLRRFGDHAELADGAS